MIYAKGPKSFAVVHLVFCLTLGLLFHFQSRERLLRALRAMNAGDAADQVIRQVDKMIKNTERASRDARLGKVISELVCLTFSNFLFI